MPTAPPPEFVDALRPIVREQILRERAEAPAVAARSRREFRMLYRRLDSGRLYGQVFAPWQEEHFFAPIDRGMSLWSETPRGHDRTDGEGWQICTDLQYGPPNQRGIIIAADRDQAALPLERCDRYSREMPWCFPDVRVHQHVIYGPNGSKCLVLSSDAASSLGEKPDWVFVEEIGVWAERGKALWTSIVGACSKVGAPIRVLTNPGAGKQGNWRWAARVGFQSLADEFPDRYHLWVAPGWVAEWSRGRIEELRRLFPSLRDQRRFIDGVWLEQDESPAFDGPDVDAVFDVPAFRVFPDRVEVVGQEPAAVLAMVQSTDYGLTNDALCAGVLALDALDRVWVADSYAAAGRPGDQASLLAVEKWLRDNMAKWPIEATLFDPHQAVHTMQEFGDELRAEQYDFNPASKRRHYAALLARVRARTLKAKPGAFRRTHANEQTYDLRRELIEAVEQNGASGSTMLHPEGGHDDAGVTCAMACERLADFSLNPGGVYAPKAAPRTLGWKKDPRRRARA